MLSKRRHKILF